MLLRRHKGSPPPFFLFFSITSVIEGRSVRSLTCGNTCVRAKENEWEGKKRSNWGAVSASESENLKSSKGSCARLKTCQCCANCCQ